MLFPKSRFVDVYTDIKDAARNAGGGCSVLLAVAADVDAICAARIFATFLRGDGIEFRLSPVAGYGDVKKCIEESGASLKSVILFNCGGNADLSRLLDVSNENMMIYVLDSHLPYHHRNVNNTTSILILDWTADRTGVPTDGDSEIWEEQRDEDFGDLDLEGVETNIVTDASNNKKRRSHGTDDDDDDDDQEDVENDSRGAGSGGSSRRSDAEQERDSAGEGAITDSGGRRAKRGARNGKADEDDGQLDGSASASRRKSAAVSSESVSSCSSSGGVALKEQLDEAAEEEENHASFAIVVSSSSSSKKVADNTKLLKRLRKSTKDSDDDDDDDDDDDRVAGRRRDRENKSKKHRQQKRQRGGVGISGSSHTDDDEYDDDDDDGEEEDEFNDRAALVASRRRTKATIEAYSNYYFHKQTTGIPVSLFLHELAEQLNRCRNDILWLACVGCTAPFLSEQLSRVQYLDVYQILRRSVIARNLSSETAFGGGISTRPVDEETGDVLHAGRDGYIRVLVDEPRFVAHRHWTLYDAMQYSDYVATRLCINIDDKGTSTLDKLIAKTGVPAKTCKQSFVHMLAPERLRFMNTLKSLVDDDIWRMPHDELFYPSFERHVERETPRSAADVVYSLNGLLAAGNVSPAMLEAVLGTNGGKDGADGTGADGGGAGGKTNSSGGGGGGAVVGLPPSSGSPGAGAAGASAFSLAFSGNSMSEVSGWASLTWRDNFAKAYNSLSRKDRDLFEEGLLYTKGLRHSVARVAPAVVRAGCVHNAPNLRWIEVDGDVTDSERRIFAQPIALAELGRMLVRVHRDSTMAWRTRKGRVDVKPLVITLRHGKGLLLENDENDESHNGGDHHEDDHHRQQHGGDRSGTSSSSTSTTTASSYITVMGVPIPAAEGGSHFSNFLEIFREAAEGTGSRYRIESFDSATLLLDARDLPKFLNYLDPEVTEATG